MSALYRIAGRVALLGAGAVTAITLAADLPSGFLTLLVFGLGVVHAGCERGRAIVDTPQVDPPQRGA